MRFPTTFAPQFTTKPPQFTIERHGGKRKTPAKTPSHRPQKIYLEKSTPALERLPGEVIKRVGQQREHKNTHKVVVQRIVIAEARDRALRRGFVEFHANADQAHNASRSNETRGVKAAGRDFGFDGSVASRNGVEDRPATGISMGGIRGIKVRVLSEPGFAIGVPKRERSLVLEVGLARGLAMHDKVDQPAHDSADEDGERGGDGAGRRRRRR